MLNFDAIEKYSGVAVDTYPMPDPVMEKILDDVEIQLMRKGDTLFDASRVVETVKTGPKWTELLDAEGKRILRLPKESIVMRQREVETKDSQVAIHRVRKNRSLLVGILSAKDNVQAALQNLNDTVEQYGYATESALSTLLKAQADMKVWGDFSRMANGEGAEKRQEKDLYDSMKTFSKHLGEKLIEGAQYNALSRSTSVLTNIMNDVDREAAARFIENARWS